MLHSLADENMLDVGPVYTSSNLVATQKNDIESSRLQIYGVNWRCNEKALLGDANISLLSYTALKYHFYDLWRIGRVVYSSSLENYRSARGRRFESGILRLCYSGVQFNSVRRLS